MNENQKKLKKLSKGKKSNYLKDAEYRIRNRRWLGYSSNIARRILAALEDKENSSQKKLATTINVSPQYISKVLKGHENLSLETIAKLSDSLGVELITFPQYKWNIENKHIASSLNFFPVVLMGMVAAKYTPAASNKLSIESESSVLLTKDNWRQIEQALSTKPFNNVENLVQVGTSEFALPIKGYK